MASPPPTTGVPLLHCREYLAWRVQLVSTRLQLAETEIPKPCPGPPVSARDAKVLAEQERKEPRAQQNKAPRGGRAREFHDGQAKNETPPFLAVQSQGWPFLDARERLVRDKNSPFPFRVCGPLAGQTRGRESKNESAAHEKTPPQEAERFLSARQEVEAVASSHEAQKARQGGTRKATRNAAARLQRGAFLHFSTKKKRRFVFRDENMERQAVSRRTPGEARKSPRASSMKAQKARARKTHQEATSKAQKMAATEVRRGRVQVAAAREKKACRLAEAQERKAQAAEALAERARRAAEARVEKVRKAAAARVDKARRLAAVREDRARRAAETRENRTRRAAEAREDKTREEQSLDAIQEFCRSTGSTRRSHSLFLGPRGWRSSITFLAPKTVRMLLGGSAEEGAWYGRGPAAVPPRELSAASPRGFQGFTLLYGDEPETDLPTSPPLFGWEALGLRKYISAEGLEVIMETLAEYAAEDLARSFQWDFRRFRTAEGRAKCWTAKFAVLLDFHARSKGQLPGRRTEYLGAHIGQWLRKATRDYETDGLGAVQRYLLESVDALCAQPQDCRPGPGSQHETTAGPSAADSAD